MPTHAHPCPHMVPVIVPQSWISTGYFTNSSSSSVTNCRFSLIIDADIFRFWCFHSFEVYSIDSTQMIRNYYDVSNFNRLFLKLSRFICNQPPVPPSSVSGYLDIFHEVKWRPQAQNRRFFCRLGFERWNRMFWNLGPMSKWSAIFLRLVASHLKDD